jgi:hypothetical protein
MNYLVIENDEVVNVVVADTAEIAAEVTGKEVLEATENGPGIGWVRSNGEWSNPNHVEPEVAEGTILTELVQEPTE